MGFGASARRMICCMPDSADCGVHLNISFGIAVAAYGGAEV